MTMIGLLELPTPKKQKKRGVQSAGAHLLFLCLFPLLRLLLLTPLWSLKKAYVR